MTTNGHNAPLFSRFLAKLSEAVEDTLTNPKVIKSGRLDIWGDGLPNKSVEWTFGVITEQ